MIHQSNLLTRKVDMGSKSMQLRHPKDWTAVLHTTNQATIMFGYVWRLGNLGQDLNYKHSVSTRTNILRFSLHVSGFFVSMVASIATVEFTKHGASKVGSPNFAADSRGGETGLQGWRFLAALTSFAGFRHIDPRNHGTSSHSMHYAPPIHPVHQGGISKPR